MGHSLHIHRAQDREVVVLQGAEAFLALFVPGVRDTSHLQHPLDLRVLAVLAVEFQGLSYFHNCLYPQDII